MSTDLNRKKIQLVLQNKLVLKKKDNIPTIKEIHLSMGLKASFSDHEKLILYYAFLLMFGKRPSGRKAYKSIAEFNLKEGQVSGFKCIFSQSKTQQVFKRILNLVFSKQKDYVYLVNKNSLVEKSSLENTIHIGLKDLFLFPEIGNSNYHSKGFLKNQGIQISFIIESKNVKESHILLSLKGLPIKR